MDARARIPVTLPRDAPTTPFWQDPPDAAVADLRTTATLPAAVDVVIVGSGITGAGVAYHLLGLDGPSGPGPSSPSVLMLEARQAASGATGRNGGHTKTASYRAFLDNAAALGSTAAAVQVARLEHAGMRAVHAVAARLGIACDAHACDTVDVVYDAAQWARAQQAVAAMRAAMPADDPAAAYTLYAGADAARAAGIPCQDLAASHPAGPSRVCGVVRYEAGSVSAYRFVAGVLKACLARGLNLQTHTPAESLAPPHNAADGTWAVRTARGTVAARHVVLATNAYTAFLVPALQGVVVPLRGQISMRTPPRPPGERLATTYSFIYDGGYEYMITRPPGARAAGAMLIGGGLRFADPAHGPGGLAEYGTTDDTAVNPVAAAYLRAAPAAYLGASWGDGPAAEDHNSSHTTAEWTGIMGYTPDGMPLVGELLPSSERLWLCCAFQGHGMVYAWPCARAVAAMVQGRDGAGDGADAAALATWFPAAFRVTAPRLARRFAGRLHTSVGKEEGKGAA